MSRRGEEGRPINETGYRIPATKMLNGVLWRLRRINKAKSDYWREEMDYRPMTYAMLEIQKSYRYPDGVVILKDGIVKKGTGSKVAVIRGMPVYGKPEKLVQEDRKRREDLAKTKKNEIILGVKDRIEKEARDHPALRGSELPKDLVQGQSVKDAIDGK